MGIKADQLHEFLHTLLDALGRPVFDLRDQTDVAGHGEMGEQADFLDGVADGAAQSDGVPIAGGAAMDPDLAGARGQQVVDEFEGGGFARAAAAEKDQGFAGVDF